MPILDSCLATLYPGKSFSTIKAEIPLTPWSASVMAMTVMTSATGPLEMKCLDPLMMYCHPF